MVESGEVRYFPFTPHRSQSQQTSTFMMDRLRIFVVGADGSADGGFLSRAKNCALPRCSPHSRFGSRR